MDQNAVEHALIKIVCDLQKLSGRDEVPVSASTRPISDMPGFDSLNGVEATVDILDQLKIEADFNNVFAEEDRSLTIKEAATRLCNTAVK
jgi:acyl carrier protein